MTPAATSNGSWAIRPRWPTVPDKDKSTFDRVLFHVKLPARGADGKAEKIVHKLHLQIKNEW